jgi:hypothetical protein
MWRLFWGGWGELLLIVAEDGTTIARTTRSGLVTIVTELSQLIILGKHLKTLKLS